MPEEYDLGKLVASIALDIDEMKQDVKDAKSKLNELGSAEKQLTEDTKKASDGFTVMKGVLSDLVSAGIKKASEAFINLAKDIVQTGQQFSASMSEVQAISGATGSELEKLEQTAREFGATTKFSATEAADALKYMALAGWDAETSMAALPGVLDLAAASGMNLAAASDMVTDYLSAFGMEAEEASYMADLLTYAQGNSNTSAQQLGEAWKNCAANLNAAGQDVETVTSLLEAMANQGLKGSEAGTAVTAMMRDLTNKMDDGKITIGETSVTVQDAEGNFRDLTAILANVEQAVDGMGTAQRAAALSGTFTEESLKGLNLVLNEGVSNVSTYEEALRNSTGAAADAASTMSDNLSGDLKTMESAFEELKLKIFEDAEGPLRDIVQMVTRDGVPAIEALINNIDKLIPVVVTAAAAMGSYKAAVAVQSIVKGAQLGIQQLTTSKIANTAATQAETIATQAETAATEGAAAAQASLNTTMAANPIGLVVGALGALIAGLTSVGLTASDSADAINSMNDALDEINNTANDTINNAEAEASLISELGKRYEELRQKQNLSVAEEMELSNITEKLAEKMGLTTEELKDQAGGYKDLSKEIESYSKTLVAKAKVEAATEAYKEAYKKQLEAKREWLDGYKKLAEEGIAVFNEETGLYEINLNGLDQSQQQEIKDLGTLGDAYKAAGETVDAYSAEIEKAQKELAALQKATEDDADVTYDAKKSFVEAKKEIEEFKKELEELRKVQSDELDELKKQSSEALSTVQKTAQNLNNVQKEIQENGKISLSTLSSLQKEYPELCDLVNEYIAGVKNEQDVISELSSIYNSDVENYNAALTAKKIAENGFLQEAAKNSTELVDKYKEQYGIDLTNFTTAAAAKIAIQEEMYKKLLEAKEKYDKLFINKSYGISIVNGEYYLTKDGTQIAKSYDGGNTWVSLDEKYKSDVDYYAKTRSGYFDAQEGYYSFNLSDDFEKNLVSDISKYYNNSSLTPDSFINISNNSSAGSNSSSGGSSTSGGPSSSDGRTKYTTTVGYSWKGESYNASYDFYEGDDTSTLEADTRAKALLGLLDRVKSMGKVTAQEEISYLNDVLKTANLSADQQYEIRQRLYNAQKSFAESEKKAQEDALKAEYDRIEKSKNRGEISTKEEIEQLENIKKKFVLTTEQKIALEEKLYDKRKQLREEEQKAQEEAIKAEYARIEKSRSRGEISTKQEIEQLEKIYKKYKLTTEQKAELDDKLYEKRKQLQEENLKAEYEQIEKKKSRNEISTKEEIAQLEKIYRKYKLTTEQKEELDEKLYEKRQQLRSEEISALDKLGDAVVTALKSKYAQQKELEEKRLDESVESWQKWEDETVNSIQGQIDALDELKEAHEEENKREEYENKRQALELELRYEKDDYNRKQIQKEIAALDKEENERLFSVQIEERKKALQEQQEEAKELSKAKQEEIQNTKAEMSARYDELMTEFALQGEAKKFILESSQDEITQLINSYASDYEMLGTTLGESLYNGISKKVNDIVAYVDSIAKKTDTQAERDKAAKALEKYVSSGAVQGSANEPAVIPAANKVISFADSFSDILRRISESVSLYKQQMSSVANSSAMHFYQTQRNYSTNSSTNNTRNSKTINVNTTVNFQRQVNSPAQMKRRLEGILVDVAKQM